MQSVIHSVFIHQDEGGHYQEIVHSTTGVNHQPCQAALGVSTHRKCSLATVKLLCISYAQSLYCKGTNNSVKGIIESIDMNGEILQFV